MKTISLLLLFVVYSRQSLFSSAKKERRLKSYDEVYEDLEEHIQETQDIVKACIEVHLSAKNESKPELDRLIEDCAGKNFEKVKKIYTHMINEVKEVTKEKLKTILSDEQCEDNMDVCMRYYNVVEFFIKKEYNIRKSLEFNRPYLEKQFDAGLLNHLIETSEDMMVDFDNVRENMIKKMAKLQQFIKEEMDKYYETHHKDKYMVNEEKKLFHEASLSTGDSRPFN